MASAHIKSGVFMIFVFHSKCYEYGKINQLTNREIYANFYLDKYITYALVFYK